MARANCPACQGAGHQVLRVDCAACEGHGVTAGGPCAPCTGSGLLSMRLPCPACVGPAPRVDPERGGGLDERVETTFPGDDRR